MAETKASEVKSEMNVQDIKIHDIKIVENVRVETKELEGLMRDIKQQGLRQPIGVTKTKSNDYVLMWGNRRLAAIKKLGWHTVPAHVYDEMHMSELLLHNLGENLHRESVSPTELGRICDRLLKYELNVSEISAKLNIPKTAVVRALDLYHEMPDKYRQKVAYYGPGSKIKTGDIPASVAHKILSCSRMYKLSDASKEKLMKVAKVDELSISEINLISKFLEQGHSVSESLDALQEYAPYKIDLFVNKREIEEAAAKYKMDSTMALLQAIVYGLIPPLKKPDFVKLRNLPDIRDKK